MPKLGENSAGNDGFKEEPIWRDGLELVQYTVTAVSPRPYAQLTLERTHKTSKSQPDEAWSPCSRRAGPGGLYRDIGRKRRSIVPSGSRLSTSHARPPSTE